MKSSFNIINLPFSLLEKNIILINLDYFSSSKEFSDSIIEFISNHDMITIYETYHLKFLSNSSSINILLLYPYVTKEDGFDKVFNSFYINNKEDLIFLIIEKAEFNF